MKNFTRDIRLAIEGGFQLVVVIGVFGSIGCWFYCGLSLATHSVTH